MDDKRDSFPLTFPDGNMDWRSPESRGRRDGNSLFVPNDRKRMAANAPNVLKEVKTARANTGRSPAAPARPLHVLALLSGPIHNAHRERDGSGRDESGSGPLVGLVTHATPEIA